MNSFVLIADSSELQDEALYSRLYRAAPEYRKEKICSMKFPADKRLSLAAWALLGVALKRGGMDEADLVLCTGEYGKPYFKGVENFFFNLSHSGSRAICSVSGVEIGCDVEQIKERSEGIAERFFHPAENAWLRLFEGGKRTEEFCRLWTLKESYLKCIGKGINIQLDSFAVLFDDSGKPYLDLGKYKFYEHNPLDGYRYACCLPEGQEPADFENIILKKQIC